MYGLKPVPFKTEPRAASRRDSGCVSGFANPTLKRGAIHRYAYGAVDCGHGFVVYHPFARKKANGWGTALFQRDSGGRADPTVSIYTGKRRFL
jgi:hypothetical protein